MAEIESIRPGFSTADAGYPRLVFHQGDLLLEFTDWRECATQVRFEDAVAFCWNDGEVGLEEHRDDECYIIHDSPLRRKHVEYGTISESEEHAHYRLCFNAVGVLDVLALGIVSNG